LWSGVSDDELAQTATRAGSSVANNLKDLSKQALEANAPYSDNTTGTALLWMGN
jgi:hypothetical protein